MYVSVIGAGECGPELSETARQVGFEVGRRGHVLVCGGLGGVMDAAARGAAEAGGFSIGILPGPDRVGASVSLTYSMPTGMGEARNALVARAADALIAIGGGYGTLSEIALALKMRKAVIGLETWELPGREPWPVRKATSAAEAVQMAERATRVSKGGFV